jgi:hypothetical protein
VGVYGSNQWASKFFNFASLVLSQFCDFAFFVCVAFGVGPYGSFLGGHWISDPVRSARIQEFKGWLSRYLRRSSLMLSYGPGGVVSRGGLQRCLASYTRVFDLVYPFG